MLDESHIDQVISLHHMPVAFQLQSEGSFDYLADDFADSIQFHHVLPGKYLFLYTTFMT